MSFNPKNPIYSPEVSSDPSSPPTGTRGLYPKSDGWYDIDDNGKFKKILVDTDETLETDSKNIIGAINEVKNTKADEIELERLKYYGDKDIVPSDESYFTVNETGETITGLTDAGKTQTELVIPYVINGILITQIRENCFLANKSITKVIIPNSVTSIGYQAFTACTSLTSINIPNSVISISMNAFNGCSSLTSINIPNSVTSIWQSAFNSCMSLTSINIPNSVTSIWQSAFNSCMSLTSLNIPKSVTSIAGSAFSGCPNLTIYCEQGSYAETYAKANNIPVVYTDISESYVRNLRPYVKNTISAEEALSLNTIYDIGIQSDLTLILPTAEVGNFIQVDFLSGATAATLTVSASSSALLSDYDFTPEPNMIYSLFFDYGVLGYDETAQSNIYGWRFNYAEYTYTPDGSEG